MAEPDLMSRSSPAQSELLTAGLGQPQVLTAQGCCGQLRPGRVSPVAGGISRLW